MDSADERVELAISALNSVKVGRLCRIHWRPVLRVGSSKKKLMLETATYRSEFCTARVYVALIIEHRNYLGHFGVPIYEKTSTLSDNLAMIYDARLLFSIVLKRHPILTYHNVRTITTYKGEYQLSQMGMFSAEYIQANERGAIQVPTNMNSNLTKCVFTVISLFSSLQGFTV